MPRLYLVSPSHHLADGRLVKTTRYWTSGLTMPTLKALAPRDWKVDIVDELMADVDLDHPADVVAIGAMGPQISRAYDLADAFRARGKKVVLGGPWVSLAPHERSLAHADAIVVGEAETVFARALEDLAAGRSAGVYRAGEFVRMGKTLSRPKNDDRTIAETSHPDIYQNIDYRDLQLIRWDKWKTSPFYRLYFHWPLVFSRGCPHPCNYCAVQAFYKRSYRTRNIDAVIENVRQIKAFGGRNLLFLDDNPIADVDAAKELFARLIPEKIKWTSQCTIEIARDPELLDLAARSGCVALSIGLESNEEPVLDSLKKRFNRAPRYAEDLAALRAKGIQVIALMMFGMDGQTDGVFDETLKFLVDHKVSLVKFFTPAPYPGTAYHEEMRQAGRILNEDWGRYDYGSLLVQPTGMDARTLRSGFDRTYKHFYGLPAIAKRMLALPRRNRREHAAYLVANLKTWHFLKKNPSAWGTIS
ncbi:B12-binding domain-containing radical SAM protein [Pendulispora brunnea]|uniref:B12-binding domain-containing radical SAM protein n=1 Tax=Pendulispora brunnea TaxID=2905690 RepID=A0ABZ2KFV4_9BACT